MKRLTKLDWLAVIIILIGIVIRLYHLFSIPLDQPFRLGGLFYEFSRQIINNNFSFPEIIPYYSAGGIPYAYPPLSFYFQAIVIKIFSPPLFFSVNLIPPFFSLLSLPAFYWMIRQYTEDIQLALVGLFTFAVMPPAFINQIEAAGMAESFGVFFLILYLGYLFRWLKDPNWKDSILAGLILGFCIISSPGSAYAATLISILFFIWALFKGLKNRALKPVSMLIILGTIGLLNSAPYWLSVTQNFGAGFIIKPFLEQHQISTSLGQFEQIISFQPAGEYLSFIWNGLILAGLIWTILQRQFTIVTVFVVFWLIPREGIWLVSIPGAILAGCGIVYVLQPLFSKASQINNSDRLPLAPGILGVIFFILVIGNSIFAINVMISDPEWMINRDQIDALSDFQEVIPINGKVIILGNLATAEWAPVFLEREVLNIEFGLEWQPDELGKAHAINTALEDDNFEDLIMAIKDYTNDHEAYLISSTTTTEHDQYENILQKNHNIIHLATTPGADLYVLEIK
jgi:hypothetical protein